MDGLARVTSVRSLGRRRALKPTRRSRAVHRRTRTRIPPFVRQYGTSCLGERWPFVALVMRARTCASSRALGALPRRWRGPTAVVGLRTALPALDRSRRHADHPTRGMEPCAGDLGLVRPSGPSRLVLLVGVDVLVLLQGLEFFLSTSNAAASASALSFRASSRSSIRIRFIVASDARPSSPRQVATARIRPAGRPRAGGNPSAPHPSTGSPSPNPNLLLDRPVVPRALRGHDWKNPIASCNHRESVCWRRPVSNASCRALTASFPVKRVTIFCLKARRMASSPRSSFSPH